jgi:hypothetical protein
MSPAVCALRLVWVPRSRAAGPERTGLCVKNRDHDFVIVTL